MHARMSVKETQIGQIVPKYAYLYTKIIYNLRRPLFIKNGNML